MIEAHKQGSVLIQIILPIGFHCLVWNKPCHYSNKVMHCKYQLNLPILVSNSFIDELVIVCQQHHPDMDTSFTNGHRIFVSELEVGAALLVLVAWMEFLMGHGEVWFLGSLTYVFLLHSIRCKGGLNTACGAYGIVIHSYVCVAPSLHAVRIVSQTGKEGINTETEIL